MHSILPSSGAGSDALLIILVMALSLLAAYAGSVAMRRREMPQQ